ncbi:MAG: adenylate kinase [Ginsengibacter sp.]|jgi:adenylate kinase
MFNLILFGPPGSGKGTQSEKLIEKYNLKHVSTGELLRSEIARETPLGIKAKVLMDKGNLVPDDVVIGMMTDTLDHNQNVRGFLFDGFPRTAVQANALDRLLETRDTCISVMLSLHVNEDELVARLSKRGETSGRPDDNDVEIIKSRLVEYHNKTAVVADHYKEANKSIVVNGFGSIDDVFNRLCKEVDRLINEEADCSHI